VGKSGIDIVKLNHRATLATDVISPMDIIVEKIDVNPSFDDA